MSRLLALIRRSIKAPSRAFSVGAMIQLPMGKSGGQDLYGETSITYPYLSLTKSYLKSLRRHRSKPKADHSKLSKSQIEEAARALLSLSRSTSLAATLKLRSCFTVSVYSTSNKYLDVPLAARSEMHPPRASKWR